MAAQFCLLCSQFSADILCFKFIEPEELPPGWVKEPHPNVYPSWGAAFHHHEDISALRASADQCELCHAFFKDLSSRAADTCKGWLGLYPWASACASHKAAFRLGFSGSITQMGGVKWFGMTYPHVFRFCERRQWYPGGTEINPKQPDSRYRFVTADDTGNTLSSSDDIFVTARDWLKNCQQAHQDCPMNPAPGPLPTRVIDVGVEATSGSVLLHVPASRQLSRYAALSHCWGGNIPNKTLQDSLEARKKVMLIVELPKNFQDAIEITRQLGLRYLWIDALCILQDSSSDWKAEAARMAEVYSNATIMISALSAPCSTSGILGNRFPAVVLNKEYGIQRAMPEFTDVLEGCALNSRAWGMQERFLPPWKLIFGGVKMFWKCRSGFASEDGIWSTHGGYRRETSDFIELRKKMGLDPMNSWETWYKLIQEYSTRQLTVASDMLPALAGAVTRFRQDFKTEGTYIAGLWKEDIARGILWGAHYFHASRQKVWGYSTASKCAALTRADPAVQAPSWSWISVTGDVDFWCTRIGNSGSQWLDVRGIDMDAGENDPNMPNPRGRLKVRGPIVHMFYRPPASEEQHVGSLTFNPQDDSTDTSVSLTGCVMDINRHTARRCWALIAALKGSDRYILILKRRPDGFYRRVGFGTAYSSKIDPTRFTMTELTLV